MKKDFYYLSRDGLTQIHGIEWKPTGKVKAVLQICHGMQEYIDRYDDFARYLNQQGYYVVGHDHLGHGKSVRNETFYGYFHETKGNEYVVKDIHTLRRITQKKYKNVPYFIMGHSMGSFLVRQYIELYGNHLSGAIIMGTGSQPEPVLLAGKMICRVLSLFRGWSYRSSFVDHMVFGSNNKQFKPTRTANDWLTKDEKIVDAYNADPLCTFQFTLNGYYQMFRGIQFIQRKENIKKIPSALPLFLVAGAADPVGNNGKGVIKVYHAYKNAGIKEVRMKLYPDDRHEILNETDRQIVYADLLHWLNTQCRIKNKLSQPTI